MPPVQLNSNVLAAYHEARTNDPRGITDLADANRIIAAAFQEAAADPSSDTHLRSIEASLKLVGYATASAAKKLEQARGNVVSLRAGQGPWAETMLPSVTVGGFAGAKVQVKGSAALGGTQAPRETTLRVSQLFLGHAHKEIQRAVRQHVEKVAPDVGQTDPGFVEQVVAASFAQLEMRHFSVDATRGVIRVQAHVPDNVIIPSTFFELSFSQVDGSVLDVEVID